MEKKKLIAVFMITLILTLPFFSANALASVTLVSIKGESGEYDTSTNTGYMAASGDTLTAIMNSDGPTVVCQCNPGTPLVCQASNPGYTCTYTDDSSFEAGKYDYTFYQIDSDNRPVGDAASAKVIVDELSPTVNTFSVDVIGRNLTARIKSTDKAFQAGSECSGIRSIVVYMDGDEAARLDNATSPGGCVFDDDIPLPNPTDGEHEFYADITDYVGSTESTNVVKIYTDLSPPELVDAYLIKGGARLSYASTKQIQGVSVVVKLKDHNLSLSSVTGDLSGLTQNPAAKPELQNKQFSCRQESGEMYNCTSPPITIYMFNPPSGEIKITAEDAKGNRNTQNRTITLTLDSETPKASFIGTSQCNAEGVCFVKQGNNIIEAEIEKSGGAGLSGTIIHFKAPSLGISTPIRMDRCTEENGVWKCVKIVQLGNYNDGTPHELSLAPPLQDDVGNEIAPISTQVIYDKTAPTLSLGEDAILFKKDGTERTYLSYSDPLKIELKAIDETSGVKTAFADLSKVIPGESWVEATSCIPQSGYHLCTWNTNPVYAKTLTENVKFNITDFAGNTNYAQASLTIYKPSNKTIDFWSVGQIKTDPPTLDRTVSQYVPGMLSIWAQVSLASSQSVKLVHAEISGNCEGVDNAYLESAKVYPITPQKTQGTSSSITIIINLRKDAPLPDNQDSLRFKCPVLLTSVQDKTVYPAEQDYADVVIPISAYGYDLPADYAARIDTFKEDLKDTAWLDSVKAFIDIGEKVCAALKLILGVIHAVEVIQEFIAIFASGVPFLKGLELASIAASKSLDYAAVPLVGKYATWVCGFFDCTLWDKLIKTYDPNGESGFNTWRILVNAYTTSLTSNVANYTLTFKSVPDKDGNLRPQYTGVGSKQSDGTRVSVGEVWDSMAEDSSNIIQASKQSLFVSVVALCIPGIVYNLEKARQIDCMYVACAERFTEAGMNAYTCEAMRANGYCNFVYGQMFHIIPFSGLLEFVGNVIKMFTSSPWAALGMLFGTQCWVMPEAISFNACMTYERLQRIVTFFQGVFQNFQFITGQGEPKDWCEEVLDE